MRVMSSPGRFRSHSRPSLTSYMSSAVNVRSPPDPRSVKRAPKAIMTGTVSLELTAQHFLEPGAVQQVSPSHFKQWLIARRHS
jgi:hypothetical protein